MKDDQQKAARLDKALSLLMIDWPEGYLVLAGPTGAEGEPHQSWRRCVLHYVSPSAPMRQVGTLETLIDGSGLAQFSVVNLGPQNSWRVEIVTTASPDALQVDLATVEDDDDD